MLIRLAVLAVLITTPVLAQHPHQDSEASLVGTWEGVFASEMAGTGGMKLVITKDGAWKAVLTLSRDEAMVVEAGSFTVKGNELSWTIGLHGTDCDSTATREGSVIKGETSCGRPVFTFELKKVK